MIKFITTLIAILTLTINVVAEEWPQCTDYLVYPSYGDTCCFPFVGCSFTGNRAYVCKEGNSFDPQITVTLENCFCGSCQDYSCTLSVLNAECCALAGSYRFCARPALAGDYTNDTNTQLDYTTFPYGDPRYGELNPRSQMCGFDDPCDLKDVCTMPGSPGNMPCHYHKSPSECKAYLTQVYTNIDNNNTSLSGLQMGSVYVSNQGMEAIGLAVTADFVTVMALPLVGQLLAVVLGPILALMIAMPWVNEEVSHSIGCVDWPQAPYPPPYPVQITNTIQAAFAENICKTGEFPTCDNLCVNSYTTTSSFTSPAIRVGYRDAYTVCSSGAQSCDATYCNNTPNASTCAYICNASYILSDNGNFVSELPECPISGGTYNVSGSSSPCVCLPTTATAPDSDHIRLMLQIGGGTGIIEGGSSPTCQDATSCEIEILGVDLGNYDDLKWPISATGNSFSLPSIKITDPLSKMSGTIYLGPDPTNNTASSTISNSQCAPNLGSSVTLSSSLNRICAYNVQSGTSLNGCSNNNQQIACFDRPAMSLPLLELDASYNYNVNSSNSDISVSDAGSTNYLPQVNVTIDGKSATIPLGAVYPMGSSAWLYGWQVGLMAYDNYGNTSQSINFSPGNNQGELCGYYDSSGNYLGGLEYSFTNNKAQYVRGASKVCLTNLSSQQNALVSLQSVATSFMCQDWCTSKGGQCANSSGTVCNSTCCDSSGDCCNSGTKEYCVDSTCASCADPNGNCTACGSFFHLCNITNDDGTQVTIDNNTGNVTVSQGTCRAWNSGSSICTVYNTDGTVTRNQYVTGNFSLNVTVTNQCGTCGTCIPGVGEITCTTGTPVTQHVYQDGSSVINYSSTSTSSTAPNTSLLGITGASEVIIIPYDYCSPVGDNAATLPSICDATYLPPSGVSIGCPASFNSATASLRPLTGLEMDLCIDVPSITSSDDSCVTIPPSSTDPSPQTICTANAPPVSPPAHCPANTPLPSTVILTPNPLCNPTQYPYCPVSSTLQ